MERKIATNEIYLGKLNQEIEKREKPKVSLIQFITSLFKLQKKCLPN